MVRAVLCLCRVWTGSSDRSEYYNSAGHTLQAWLDAFNRRDRARIETYVKTVDPSQSVDGMIAFRNQTVLLCHLRCRLSTPIAHEQISVVTDGRSLVEAHTKDRLPRDFSNSPPTRLSDIATLPYTASTSCPSCKHVNQFSNPQQSQK